jgi:hypothetical protein
MTSIGIARYHSGYAIAGHILLCAVISIVSAALLTDRTNQDISHDCGTAQAQR